MRWRACPRTCPSCGREHDGKGYLCAHCNNPGRVNHGGVHTGNDLDRISHMYYTDDQTRSEDEGWWYEDGDHPRDKV